MQAIQLFLYQILANCANYNTTVLQQSNPNRALRSCERVLWSCDLAVVEGDVSGDRCCDRHSAHSAHSDPTILLMPLAPLFDPVLTD